MNAIDPLQSLDICVGTSGKLWKPDVYILKDCNVFSHENYEHAGSKYQP